MDQSELDALYQEYLGRPADPSGIATWSSQDPSAVIAGITGSQEYQNRGGGGGDSGGGGGSPAPAPSSDPSAQVAQIYQSVLGRAPDAGAQGWIDAIASGADPTQIAQQIASSQEGKNYAASNPQAQFSGLASLSQANNPLAGTTSAYNNMQYVGGGTDPSSGDQTYQYKDSSGGTVTVDSSGNPTGYTPGPSWYQQQLQSSGSAGFRPGYGGETYLATGAVAPSTYNVNGKQVPITNTYEYQVNPKTGQFITDANGNYVPVDRQQSSGGFTDFMTSPAGALTAMALLGGAGLALPALAGEGALGAGMVDAAGNIIGAGAEGAAVGSGAAGTAANLTPGTDLYNLMQNYPNLSPEQLQSIMEINYGVNPQLAYDAANLASTGYDAATIDQLLQYGYNASELAPLGLESLAPTLPASSLLDALPSLSSLAPYLGPLSKLLGGSGAASSALGGLTGGTKPTATLTGTVPGSTSITENYASPQGTLVHGQQIAIPGASQYVIPLEQLPQQAVNPQSLQEIKNAKTGGIIHKAVGGDMGMKPTLMRGKQVERPSLFGMKSAPLSSAPHLQAGGSMQERTLPEGHNPQFFSECGLNHRYVKGDGDGTSDSIPAMLANGEFVIPADVVSSLGNGSNDSGAKVLDEFLNTIRTHKNKHDAKHLPPDSKGALGYLLEAKRKARA